MGLDHLLCMAVAALATTRTGAPTEMLPQGPWGTIVQKPGQLQVEDVPMQRMLGGASKALRVTVKEKSDPFYAVQIFKDIPVAIQSGTRVRLEFYARSRSDNPLRAVVEKVGPPYTGVAELNLALTPTWTRYSASGTAPQFPAGGMGVRFQVGHQEGEIELADIHVWNEGLDPAVSAADEAIRPEAVEARIRQYRTGSLRIEVVDRSGKPVRGASVQIQQTQHAFLFGSNIFQLNPTDTSPLQTEYQRRFAALLNYATLPFYWGSFEPEEGRKAYERLEAMARWCREHGIVTKGHPLVWHEVYPRWAPTDPDKAVRLLEARVKEIIPRYAGLIRYWDVFNEANNAAMFVRTGTGAWVKRDGPVAAVAAALRWAREASKGTDTVLLYNDFNTTEANVRLLQGLKERRSLPDAIGIQSHMHGGVWPLTKVWMVTEQFARFGRPIHYTEVTVLSGDRPSTPAAPWVTTPEGEQKQADYVERFYSLLFSHPSVEAITWWDFSDLNAWQAAPAGFLRKDMSPKPAYERLMGLIKGKWWTHASGATDARGVYTVTAFQGTHEVTVSDGRGRTKTVSVTLPIRKKRAAVRVVLE